MIMGICRSILINIVIYLDPLWSHLKVAFSRSNKYLYKHLKFQLTWITTTMEKSRTWLFKHFVYSGLNLNL